MDEIYIHGSNPKSPQSNPGGPGDQVYYGLNATNHPPGNYVSGSVALRYKTWRATRSKTGYPGFTLEGTIYRKYASQSIYPCYLQTNTLADVVNTDRVEIKRYTTRYEPPYSEVLYDPESGTLTTNYFPGVTVSSNSVEHVILSWPGVLPWLPQLFPPTNNVSWASPYDACNPSAYADLDEPYTDRLLLAKAGKDYKRARDWAAEPSWGQALVHERPMPWNGSIQAYEKSDPFPVPAIVEDIWAASDAHRSYVHSGTNTDHTITAADLQGLVYQATSTNSIPPGFLQRCVVLAIHRAPPAPGQAEGAITNVVPYEVFLKPGETFAESIKITIPPPIQEGSIELKVVTVDLDVDSDATGVVAGRLEDDALEMLQPAPLLFNNDKDDTNSVYVTDYLESGVNGEGDLLDLAPLIIRAAGPLPPGWELCLSVDPASADGICVFDRIATNAVHILGRDGLLGVPVASWIITNTTADVVLGVEANRLFARPHTNDVVFTLALLDPAGQVVASDEAKMRTLPFLLLPNTHDADIVYVADYYPEFFTALTNAVVAAGVAIKAIPHARLKGILDDEYDSWLQDQCEIGAVRGPGGGPPSGMSQIWKLPRSTYRGSYFTEDLSEPNFNNFYCGNPSYGTSDSGGNLELIPPHQTPGGKTNLYGRVICGLEMQDEQKQFITDQGVQGPPLEVKLDWLSVGHIDEVVSFVRKPGADWTRPFDGTNAFHVLIADTVSAFALLDGLNRSRTGQPTVVEASALQCAGAGWAADEWKDGFVEITAGPGAGQVHQVAGNTADRIALKRPWAAPLPGTNSTFVVTARSAYRCLFFEGAEDLGVASPAAVNTLLDTTKNWTAGQWTNGYARIVAGPGAGESRRIIANTATNLVLDSAWTATPDGSSRYVVVEKSKMLTYEDPVTGATWPEPACETVGEVLAKHRVFNAAQQADIDKVRTALTNQVANISLIEMPSVFWDRDGKNKAFSLVPNMVNLLSLGTHLIVAKPFGPRDEAGNDLFLEDFKDRMGDGYTVHAVDAWSYHDGEGAVHCATNVKRKNFNPSEGVAP